MSSDKIVPKPFIIGISGGTASGKSTLTEKIYQTLKEECDCNICVISVDSFYKNLDETEKNFANDGKFNFDHPDAFDFNELYNILDKVSRRESAIIYQYDHQSFSKLHENFIEISPDVSVVVVEGILAFYPANIRDKFHVKVFVDCDADTRLSRRVTRDVEQNKRDIEKILANYFQFVKPAFEEFCLPTKKYADIILPRGADNVVGIDLIIQHIQDVLNHGERTQSSDKRVCSDASFVTQGHHHAWRTRQPSDPAILATRPH